MPFSRLHFARRGRFYRATAGVMIYLMGDNNPRLNVNSGSTLNIKVPQAGPYAGIAIFQDRKSKADHSILNSNSKSSIEGTVYLPSSRLRLNSGGKLWSASPWTKLVVNELELNSSSDIHLNANYGASSVPLPGGFAALQSASLARLIE